MVNFRIVSIHHENPIRSRWRLTGCSSAATLLTACGIDITGFSIKMGTQSGIYFLTSEFYQKINLSPFPMLPGRDHRLAGAGRIYRHHLCRSASQRRRSLGVQAGLKAYPAASTHKTPHIFILPVYLFQDVPDTDYPF